MRSDGSILSMPATGNAELAQLKLRIEIGESGWVRSSTSRTKFERLQLLVNIPGSKNAWSVNDKTVPSLDIPDTEDDTPGHDEVLIAGVGLGCKRSDASKEALR